MDLCAGKANVYALCIEIFTRRMPYLRTEGYFVWDVSLSDGFRHEAAQFVNMRLSKPSI